MAVDKLVDSTQLNADLTSVADAIRTKGGTSASLAFPADFVSAIAAIPTGGGGTDYLSLILEKKITTYASDVTYISSPRTFESQTLLTSVSFPELVYFYGGYVFNGCTALSSISFPKLEEFQALSIFAGCTSLITVVLPSYFRATQNAIFQNCTGLTTIDLGSAGKTTTGNIFNQNFFNGCSALSTIILRATDRVQVLGNINNFTNTRFASGGTGGTIYIPKVLYDHLGDGTSSDYKVASNWSTVDGYGTITWAKIEGSYYETHYADGTLIPT